MTTATAEIYVFDLVLVHGSDKYAGQIRSSLKQLNKTIADVVYEWATKVTKDYSTISKVVVDCDLGHKAWTAKVEGAKITLTAIEAKDTIVVELPVDEPANTPKKEDPKMNATATKTTTRYEITITTTKATQYKTDDTNAVSKILKAEVQNLVSKGIKIKGARIYDNGEQKEYKLSAVYTTTELVLTNMVTKTEYKFTLPTKQAPHREQTVDEKAGNQATKEAEGTAQGTAQKAEQKTEQTQQQTAQGGFDKAKAWNEQAQANNIRRVEAVAKFAHTVVDKAEVAGKVGVNVTHGGIAMMIGGLKGLFGK